MEAGGGGLCVDRDGGRANMYKITQERSDPNIIFLASVPRRASMVRKEILFSFSCFLFPSKLRKLWCRCGFSRYHLSKETCMCAISALLSNPAGLPCNFFPFEVMSHTSRNSCTAIHIPEDASFQFRMTRFAQLQFRSQSGLSSAAVHSRDRLQTLTC